MINWFLFSLIKDYLSPQYHLLELRGGQSSRDRQNFQEILNRVNDAAIKRKSIEIVYYTMSRKKETRRRVDPHRSSLFFTRRKAFELLSQGLVTRYWLRVETGAGLGLFSR